MQAHRSLTLEAYSQSGHVVVAPGGTLEGIADRALASAGHTRRVAMAVPYFFTALATVARTDLLATVPSRIARAHAANFGLVAVPPPMPIRPFPVRMIWDRRTVDEPAALWLRARVRQVVTETLP